ncbi:MAG: sulfite exporter TauE/SafE family protein [Acidobacteriia bacterium]|nr:sulfite exporter TauE/SafE family protein [Terriglobia bacterium]
MSAFLPVAGVSISILVLVAIGAVVGFLSGLLGVGGGVLLTPILMMIGIRPSVAAASGVNAIVATSSSGLAAHFRLGNVDLKLGSVLLFGGVAGASMGVVLIKLLRALGVAGFVITVTYIVVLGISGIYMFLDGLRRLRGGSVVSKSQSTSRVPGFLRRLPFQMNFPCSGVRHSVLLPFSLCTLVGILTAIMGVGGGFLVVPLMTGLLGVPVRVAVGTSLFQILFTSADTTLLQAIENHTVDLVMALLLAVGSTVGAQIGARVSRFLRGEQLLILLAVLALAITAKMTFGIFTTPSNLLDPAPSPSPHADRVLTEEHPPGEGRVDSKACPKSWLTEAVEPDDGLLQEMAKGVLREGSEVSACLRGRECPSSCQ